MKNLLRRARAGITSLETAVVIPVLLVVTLGAVDVARVIQAHQTLRDAAKVASRCIYPTDAACISAAPSITITNQFQYDLVSNNRETPRMDYSGTASWLSAPELLFSNFQARVLSDVQFDGQFSTDGYEARSVPPPPTFAAIGSGNYLEMQNVGIPWIHFANNSPMTPTFYGDSAGSVELTPVHDEALSLRFTSNQPAAWQTIWSSESAAQDVSWLPRALGTLDNSSQPFTCVKSASLGSLGTNRSCAEPGVEPSTSNPKHSRIAFDIRGSGSGGNAHFNVRVYMWNPSNSQQSEVKDLGGRGYNGPEDLALLPRGFPAVRLLNPALLSNRGYFDDVNNNSEIEIPWGWHFRIEGDVDGTNAHMDIQRLRIFAPRFVLRTATGSCGCGASQLSANSANAVLSASQCPVIYTDCATNTKAPGVLGAGVEPILYNGVSTMARTVTTSSTGSQPPPQYVIPITGGANGCFATEEQALARRAQTIAAAGLGNVPFQPGVFLAANQGSCSNVNVNITGATVSCPVNFGVPEEAAQNGRVVGSASAASQCPPSMENLLSANNVSWGETVTTIDHAPVTHTPSSCSNLAPDWSADQVFAQYPKFMAPVGNEVGRHAVMSEHVDPQVMKASTQYACGQFAVESRVFDDSEALRQTLFNGTHSNLGCDWENVLLGEAQAGTNVPVELRLKSYEFFTAGSAERGWDYQRTAETTCAACTSCRFNTTRATIPGLFSPGTSPAACSGLPSGTWCESRAYYVATAGQNGGVTVNETAAARIAFDEIRASIPSVKRECVGTDCAEVNVVADSAAGTVNAAVRYQMPLYVLGNRSITLSSNITERFETKFSN